MSKHSEAVKALTTIYDRAYSTIHDVMKKHNIPDELTQQHHEFLAKYFAENQQHSVARRNQKQPKRFTAGVREMYSPSEITTSWGLIG